MAFADNTNMLYSGANVGIYTILPWTRYTVVHMVEHNITDKSQWTHVLLDRGNIKAFQSAGIRPSSCFGSIQVRFRKSDQKHVFIRSVSAYRQLLIAAVIRRYHRATQIKHAR